ncbi:MAG: hypothetical protein AAF907_16455, partial [Planctomycetota bacterium]
MTLPSFAPAVAPTTPQPQGGLRPPSPGTPHPTAGLASNAGQTAGAGPNGLVVTPAPVGAPDSEAAGEAFAALLAGLTQLPETPATAAPAPIVVGPAPAANPGGDDAVLAALFDSLGLVAETAVNTGVAEPATPDPIGLVAAGLDASPVPAGPPAPLVAALTSAPAVKPVAVVIAEPPLVLPAAFAGPDLQSASAPTEVVLAGFSAGDSTKPTSSVAAPAPAEVLTQLAPSIGDSQTGTTGDQA